MTSGRRAASGFEGDARATTENTFFLLSRDIILETDVPRPP